MAYWFCKIDGQSYEPVEFETLQLRAAEGRLRAYDMVFSDGMTDWQQAGTIPGLFALVPPAIPIDMPSVPVPPPLPQPVPPKMEDHRGWVCLLLGILGIGCGLFSVAAWALSDTDLRKMRYGRMKLSGRAITRAGFVLGCSFTLLYILVLSASFVYRLVFTLTQPVHVR